MTRHLISQAHVLNYIERLAARKSELDDLAESLLNR